MKKPPRITVITPTYNRADLIVKTIESVLNQDFTDFEYFILDDGSTDNTKSVVEPYLKDKRINYLWRENTGEAQTVNWGWSLASGEYFTQVNSDDPILPTLFSEMVDALDKNKKAVLAYPDFYFIDENDKKIFENKSQDWDFLEALSAYSCYAASAGTFLRRSTFINWKTLKTSKFKHINDIEMYWNMALEGDFLHVPKLLATWRVHSGSISADRYKSIPEIEQWFEEYFSKQGIPEEVLAIKIKTKKSIYNYFIRLLKQSNLDKIEKNQKIKYYKEKLKNECTIKKNIKIVIKELLYRIFLRPVLKMFYKKSKVKKKYDRRFLYE